MVVHHITSLAYTLSLLLPHQNDPLASIGWAIGNWDSAHTPLEHNTTAV